MAERYVGRRVRARELGAHAGHGHGPAPDVAVARLPRTLLTLLLAAVAALTLAGLVHWWPDADRVDRLQGSMQYTAQGASYVPATITRLEPRCEQVGAPNQDCGHVHARVDEGAERGTRVVVEAPPEISDTGLAPGDRLDLLRIPAAQGQPVTYSYFGIQRDRPLWLLAVLFALVVVAVARLRGLMALVGLGFAAVVVAVFLLPAILSGQPVVPVAVVAAVTIMYVVLYTTHGLSLRTSVALGGTLAGVALTAAAGWYAVGEAHLTGVADEGGSILITQAPGLSLQQVLIATVVIAGLGALNDVTITQVSAAWELRAAAPGMGRIELFASAMRIGRDHVASTIYTLAFAYVGSALALLLTVQLYDRPLLDLVGTEQIAEEVVRSLAGGIGLVLAMPITTALAAVVVAGPSASIGE
jgi:uncharacterized membrane protein